MRYFSAYLGACPRKHPLVLLQIFLSTIVKEKKPGNDDCSKLRQQKQ